MHNITACHLRERRKNNVKITRQGRFLFSFLCLFDSRRKSRVKSLKKVFVKAAIKWQM